MFTPQAFFIVAGVALFLMVAAEMYTDWKRKP